MLRYRESSVYVVVVNWRAGLPIRIPARRDRRTFAGINHKSKASKSFIGAASPSNLERG